MPNSVTQILSGRRTRYGWHRGHAVMAIALAVLAIVCTWDAWSDMYRIALKDEEASHALLVPPIAVWLLWVRRGRLRHCRLLGTWVGPVLVLFGGALYLLGDKMMWQLFWHVGAITVMVGAILTILGRDVLRNFLPVFLVLAFMLPVPGRIRQKVAIPLQKATAQATQVAFELAGMPVERSGNLLVINGKDVAVGEACNGMRMTFALLLVSFAFAFTTPLNGYVRVLVVALSPFSSVVCNVIRLVPTVWVYGNASDQAAQQFHDVSGWVMLFVAFGLLMGVVRLLRWFMVPVSPFTLAYD
jgi:exosortase